MPSGDRGKKVAREGCPIRVQEDDMNLTTYKKFKGDRLMPWGKATVVTGAKGYVFLCGNTATTADYDPANQRGRALGDPTAQWREILANIKSDLEEVGSSLEHLVKLTFFVKGPFPNGGVLSSPNFRLDLLDEFFAQHCPKHCSYNNPPPSEVIGVEALAQPDIVIEIVAIAALPD
jgi:enamine deaminase RidA (YjgF/YER057c/UK114 family)